MLTWRLGEEERRRREGRGWRGGREGEERGRREGGEGEERGRREGGEGEERGRRGGGEGEERGRRGGGEGEERGRRGERQDVNSSATTTVPITQYSPSHEHLGSCLAVECSVMKPSALWITTPISN